MARASDTERRGRHDTLFTEHHAAVWRYAVRRVGADGAEDVVAETFLVAWRRLDAVPGEAELPWLLGVARRVVARQHRSADRRERLLRRVAGDRSVGVAGEAGEPAVPVDAMLAALATLPPRDQEALQLVYWDGLTTAQAALAFGCRPTAMRVRLHRARERLARTLAARGHGPAAAIDDAHPLPLQEA